MIIKSQGKLSNRKVVNIITSMCEKFDISLDKATDIFYQSDTCQLIDEGIADLHCRSPKYLAQCVWDEYQERNH